MLLPRSFFFFLRHFLKREPYTKRDWLRREGKIVVSSTRLYISRSLDSSVSSVLNTEILFLGEIQFSDMCHQGNINCMFSWCISYCKTRDEQLDFLYPNKDGVIRCLILHNLECELILLLLRFCWYFLKFLPITIRALFFDLYWSDNDQEKQREALVLHHNSYSSTESFSVGCPDWI